MCLGRQTELDLRHETIYCGLGHCFHGNKFYLEILFYHCIVSFLLNFQVPNDIYCSIFKIAFCSWKLFNLHTLILILEVNFFIQIVLHWIFFRVARFSNVEHLSIYFPENFGSDTSRIYYIGLKGDFTEVSG